MDDSHAGPPEDIDALRAASVAARAEVAIVRAQQSDDQAMIAHLKLQIEKLNRDRCGPRSERTARLLDQLEMQLEELEASATEDELAVARTADGGFVLAQAAIPKTVPGASAPGAGDRAGTDGVIYRPLSAEHGRYSRGQLNLDCVDECP